MRLTLDRDVIHRIAMRGAAIIHTNERYASNKNSLGDVLLDLIHHAAYEGIDFDKELAWARKAFAEDTTEGKQCSLPSN